MQFATASPRLLDAVTIQRPPQRRVLEALESLVARYGEHRVARLLGVTQLAVWNWRHGTRQIARDSAVRIVDMAVASPERIEETWRDRIQWLQSAS